MFGALGGVGRLGLSGIGGYATMAPSIDWSFFSAPIPTGATFTRTNPTATNVLYTDAGAYTTSGANIPRFNASRGLLLEPQKTNSLLNSDTPATQTTASLAVAIYSLWVIGSGSATVSAGTATVTGAGVATQGSPLTFNVTVAGTVTVTVGGSLTRFQLESAAAATVAPSSYIPTAGGNITRGTDLLTYPVGSWFNTSVGSVAIEFISNPVAGVNSNLWGIDDGAGNRNNIIDAFINATPGITLTVRVANAQTGSVFPTGTTPGAANKASMAWSSSSVYCSINGGTVNTAAVSGGLPTGLTRLMLATESFSGVLPLSGYLRRFRYWPRVLSTSELRMYST